MILASRFSYSARRIQRYLPIADALPLLMFGTTVLMVFTELLLPLPLLNSFGLMMLSLDDDERLPLPAGVSCDSSSSSRRLVT